MKYRRGDKIIRVSIGCKGQKATILEPVHGSEIYKVKLKDVDKEQNWHAIHFEHDLSDTLAIGDMATHTAHDHGMLVGRIVGEDKINERWEMSYGEGKKGSWLKKYTILYEQTKDITLKVKRPEKVVHDDIEDSLAQLRWDTKEREHWTKNFFNNPKKPEEGDIMKLEIEDYTTINGGKADQISVDGYITLISDAEGEVKRLEALQEGSEAIRASSAITNTIKDLKAGIERCVGFMDKATS